MGIEEKRIPCGNDNKMDKGELKCCGFVWESWRSGFPAGMTTRKAGAEAKASVRTTR
jgi:hypothetical protein